MICTKNNKAGAQFSGHPPLLLVHLLQETNYRTTSFLTRLTLSPVILTK